MTTTYIETAADHAFTLWLATRSKRKVTAEHHTQLSKPERQILAFHHQNVKPEPKPLPPVRQQFTDKQIDIALAALAARENNRKSN